MLRILIFVFLLAEFTSIYNSASRVKTSVVQLRIYIWTKDAAQICESSTVNISSPFTVWPLMYIVWLFLVVITWSVVVYELRLLHVQDFPGRTTGLNCMPRNLSATNVLIIQSTVSRKIIESEWNIGTFHTPSWTILTMNYWKWCFNQNVHITYVI